METQISTHPIAKSLWNFARMAELHPGLGAYWENFDTRTDRIWTGVMYFNRLGYLRRQPSNVYDGRTGKG